MIKVSILLIVFTIGLVYIVRNSSKEPFKIIQQAEDTIRVMSDNCPNVLVQKGPIFYLFNAKRATIPGINPIRFESLQDYTEFIEWQRSQGILCPILFLKHAYDIQGNDVYKNYTSPTTVQVGYPDNIITSNTTSTTENITPPNVLPIHINSVMNDMFSNDANIRLNDAKLNDNISPFDSHGQDIGITTPLDKLFNDTKSTVSANPMDTNWGGVAYTDKLVSSGYFN